MLDALLPLGALIFLLSLSVYLYGSDSSFGPNQMALFVAAAIAAWRSGRAWTRQG